MDIKLVVGNVYLHISTYTYTYILYIYIYIYIYVPFISTYSFLKAV